MSSKEAAPHHEEPAKEAEHKNEATKVSATWLNEKIDRWLGHSARTIGGELAIWGGLNIASQGASSTFGYAAPENMIRPAELAIGATALGSAISAAGAWAEWKMGMQHAKSKLEKGAFWLAKAGQMAAPLLDFYLPAYRPVALGLYGAGVVMGLAGMRHRPEAGKGGGGH